MAGWREALATVAGEAETQFDLLRLRLSERLGLNDPIIIQPYLGYGTPTRLHLRGRVLEDEGISHTGDEDTVWDNLLNTYRFLESDEIPGAVVRATFEGETKTVKADDEGFFELTWELQRPLPSGERWPKVTLELIDAPVAFEPPVRAVGRVFVPPTGARFGVISDIDDTVLQSSAAQLLKAARLLFLRNARTRLPFEGVAAFYRALQGEAGNPIFYVSSSPWNLYPLLTDFFAFQNIPVGPLFLRDFSVSPGQLKAEGHHGHKLIQIEKILTTYPELPFILIGDSGQEDPEIYGQVVADFPGRILAIYIRDVSLDERDREVTTIAEGLRGDGVEMVLAADTVAAARHAVANRLIDETALSSIVKDQRRDAAEPTAVEALLDDTAQG